MSLIKILLITLIAFTSSKNVVIIGDSRVCGIGSNILKIPYTYHNAVYGNGSYMVSKSGKSYQGHNIKLVAEVGASYYTFITSSKAVAKGAHSVLSASKSGTIVLLWLGVNNPSSDPTFKYYKTLANKYKNLKFYAVSVTGVGPKSSVSNQTIKNFNANLKNKIKKDGLANLKYKSILKNGDPTQVYNSATKSVVLSISGANTDVYGVHYNTNGDKVILDAMLAGI